jgi:peptide/nickel transport system substrate-binding protein
MSRNRWLAALACALVLVLTAAACGGDDDGSSAEEDSSSTSVSSSETTTSVADTPVQGGKATFLRQGEVASLDPVRMVGTGVGDGQYGHALYGSLLLTDPETFETEPFMAESFEPNADATVWVLKLRPGITMSDGSAYDAAAVKANWERAKDVANRSPSLTTLFQVASMEVTDPMTLTVTLTAPNAQFDKAIARTGINFIASAKALAEGTDLTSEAVGAGPYRLKEWLRDDRMVLERNPDWTLTDGPYLDEITFRILSEEEQRVDTFLTGDADALWTATAASAARGVEELDGAAFTSVNITTGQAFVFNTVKPPFDDLRMRKAFAQGVDWQALVDVVNGPGSVAPYNFTRADTPWFDEKATLPPYDTAAAQALIDEYAADNGGGPVKIVFNANQSSLDQARVKFVQAALSQLDNIEVEVEVLDGATNVQRVFAGEYMVASFGFPTLDPDPGLYGAVHSTSLNNYAKYNNPEVDELLDQARVTEGQAERKALYDQVYETLAEDLPFYPYIDATYGWVSAPDLRGMTLSLDSILRYELLWKQA